MKRLTCEMCGSTDMIKEDGVFVCQSCGCKYSVEEAKKMMIEGTVEVAGTVQVDKNNEIDALLKRVFMFLEEEKWKEADEYCEKVLDIDPENPEAYLGKLMVEAEWKNIDIFLQRAFGWVESKYYIKMSEYANKYVNEKVLKLLQERAEYDNSVHYSKDNAILEDCGTLLTEVFILEGTKEISSYAFNHCENLKSVTIPNSVTKIEQGAFYDCLNLESIVLPSGITEIPKYAFSGCGLKNITIPNSVTKIGDYAFQECKNLKSVTLPNSIIEIGKGVFQHSALESIIWPMGLTEIPEDTFSGCDLRNFTIPNSVTKIGDSAFCCTGLESIVLPMGIVEIPHYAFGSCVKLKNITIPNSVTKISDMAFCYCYSLKSITIPNSVTEIGKDIFGKYLDLYYSDEDERDDYIATLEILKTSEKVLNMLINGNQIRVCLNLKRIELEDGRIFSTADILPNELLCDKIKDILYSNKIKQQSLASSKSGCYVATCVYGSYDCPQVWTLRRYRDDTLGATWYGRLFIRTYYAISPTLVKWFGKTNWFKKLWKGNLDRMVAKLQSNGVEDTPYEDKNW